jgi:hypothetical protein
MNPGQARAFVERAHHAGLLTPEGDVLRLVIDPAAVEVPRGFRPRPEAEAGSPVGAPSSGSSVPSASSRPPAPASAGSAPPAPTPAAPDPFRAWVANVAAQRGATRDQVLAQVSATQEQMGGLLTAEAAVLLLARRNGLDVADAACVAEPPLHAKPNR